MTEFSFFRHPIDEDDFDFDPLMPDAEYYQLSFNDVVVNRAVGDQLALYADSRRPKLQPDLLDWVARQNDRLHVRPGPYVLVLDRPQTDTLATALQLSPYDRLRKFGDVMARQLCVDGQVAGLEAMLVDDEDTD